jgi:hypothetical protein
MEILKNRLFVYLKLGRPWKLIAFHTFAWIEGFVLLSYEKRFEVV